MTALPSPAWQPNVPSAGTAFTDPWATDVYTGVPNPAPNETTKGGTSKPPAAKPPAQPTSTDDILKSLTGDQRNAFNVLNDLFTQFGLASLAPKIAEFIKAGYDSETTAYLLRQTDEYKQRFAGNELRRQNGFSVLSEAEYLSVENGMKAAAQAYNLPVSFYDNPDDFAKLIGKNISASEFAQRAQYAFKYTQASNPQARAALHQFYGVDDSHLTAYFLDPNKGQAILDRQAASADIAGSAWRQGLSNVNKSQAEGYADLGVTLNQADNGFAQASDILQHGQMDIAQRFNSNLTTQDVEDETVTGLASARRKRDLLNQSEAALFAGNEGVAIKSGASDGFGSY